MSHIAFRPRASRAWASALACLLLAFVPPTAHAVNKTVNGITVDVNLPQAQRGVQYNFQITPSAGPGAPYAFEVLAGSLPSGLFVSSTGLVTGVNCVNANGSYPFDLRISSGATVADFVGTSNFSINMTAGPASACSITIGAGSAPSSATVGVPVSGSYSSSGGGGGPYTYGVVSGTLPPGLALGSNGAFSGTPTTPGTYSFNVRAQDAASNTGFLTATITVAAGASTLTLAPASLPGGTWGAAYSQTLSASGGSGTYTYSVTAGALPAGLALNASTGALAGTPSTVGSSTFTVQASDGTSSGTRSYTVAIAGVALAVSPASLPGGVIGTAYSQAVTASGGSGGYTYAVTSGSLPAGLALNASTGALTGTTTAPGSSTFTITATDSAGNAGSRSYTIAPTGVLSLAPSGLPDGSFGSAYSQSLAASGGTGSYVYSIASGALPDGLTLDPATGALAGTPTRVASFTFVASVTDGVQTASVTYTLAVAGVPLAIAPATLPAATAGVPFAQTLAASGGSGPYAYAVVGGTLPAGLALDAATGALAGTVGTGGSATFTVQVTDAAGNVGTRTYVLATGAALALGPTALPGGTFGAPYAQAVAGSGGTGSYGYALVAGALPDGLVLDPATGTISGLPTRVATATFTLSVTDGVQTVQRSYSLPIAAVALALTPAQLPPPPANGVYSQALAGSGGAGGYTCVVSAGSLPPGLTLDAATCVLAGRATAGTYDFEITVTDAAGNEGTRRYAFAVAAIVPAIGPAALPAARHGIAYAQSLQATGGTAPYAFTLGGGSLPPGLTLDGAGRLAGTPSAPGAYAFTVRVQDADGNVGTRAYAFAVDARPDPAQLADVAGALDGQFASARRFGEGQVDNVMRHLEGSRGAFRCGANGGVTLTRGGEDPSRARRLDATPAAGTSVPLQAQGRACDDELPQVGYWLSGTLGESGGRRGFESDALTAGVDLKIAQRLVIGAAFGFGSGESTFGDRGTHSRDDARSAMAFASFSPRAGWYFDAVAGYGRLDFDGVRHVETDGSRVDAVRDGRMLFGSLGVGAEHAAGPVTLGGYLRHDLVASRLDAYVERGTTPYALAYGRADQRVGSAVFGGRAALTLRPGWGTLTPMLRAEYRRRTTGDYDQALQYADLPAAGTYLRRGRGEHDDVLSIGAGFEARLGFVTFGLEYGTSELVESGPSGESLRATLRAGF